MKRMPVTIAVSILLLAASAYLYRRVARHNVAHQVFGSQQLLNALNTADEVAAQRLHYREGRPKGSDKLDDYVRDEIAPLAAAQALEVKRLLQDASSYDWSTDSTKSCVLDYGVLLTFRSRQRSVRVALCFNCLTLGIYDGADDTAKPVHTAEFDPARKQFTMVIKSIFPTDREIQALR